MSNFQFFMPIEKLDKDKRIVYGYASTPTKDGDGEIVTLEALKAALPGYMEYGNIREMHKLNAVGVAQEANIDTKGLFLSAKIVDDSAWEKCVEGVYKGFSIGGRKLNKSGNKITGIEMNEISVVDRPCNPDAKFNIAKAAKELTNEFGYLVKAKKNLSPEAKALAKMAKVVGGLAKAGPPAAHDGFSLPAKTKGTEISPKDSRPNENETRKAEDDSSPCKEHGKVGCEKCAVKKTEEEPKVEEKTKKTKKLQKSETEFGFELKPSNSFLNLIKYKDLVNKPNLNKSMSVAGSLSYTFDSLRNAQRSLMMEGKREGGDKKDQALAKQLGSLAKQLSDIISQKATHEGQEAETLTDADDQYLQSYLGDENMTLVSKTSSGDPMADAISNMMKRAAMPSKMQRMAMAKEDVKKSRKACKAARESVEECHKLHKAAYLSKASKKKDDKEDDFDHESAMEKLQKAYQEIDKARTMAKAASEQIEKAMGRSGQSGQEVGDSEGGFYTPPPGVIKDLTMGDMAGAGPGTSGGGSQPPMYPTDGGVYPGKANGSSNDLSKFAKNGQIASDVVELIMAKAKADGELEALRRMPAVAAGGKRPYVFDMSKITGGNSQPNPNINKALFDGVDATDLMSGDELRHTQASAKVIGNFLTSGHFGKSILDPNFKGAAGGK